MTRLTRNSRTMLMHRCRGSVVCVILIIGVTQLMSSDFEEALMHRRNGEDRLTVLHQMVIMSHHTVLNLVCKAIGPQR